MTPQESELVDQLFDRLGDLEKSPRDADAERRIADGLQRAPHAVYALVQTALLQDEALKRANARIEELQAQAESAEEPPQPPPPTSFLDSMRAALGGGQPHGSVPSVRPSGNPASPPPYPPPSGYGYAPSPGFGTGGSFLGTAASAAAGVVGGALLLDGIRSMFGHHLGTSSSFGDLSSSTGSSPWSGSAADSDLAREAGLDDIGKDTGHPQGVASDDTPDDAYDPTDDQTDFDDDDFDGGDGGGDGGSYDA
jgi:hypothetical protein